MARQVSIIARSAMIDIRSHLQRWFVPILLLLVCGLSFGVLTPWLGYYWDDWTVIYLTRLRGIDGLRELFSYDRPYSLWMYILSNAIGGDVPFHRHLLALVMRWLGVCAMWWALRGIWSQHLRLVTWMAVLFAVYPIFLQQPIALTYTQGFLLYAIYFVSLGAMVWGVRKPRYFIPLTILALFTCALHTVTVEYYIGLEFFRPFALWYVLADRMPINKKRILSVLKYWLPYLLVIICIAVWRLFFLKLPENINAPVLLHSLTESPIEAAMTLIQSALRDTFFVLLMSWYKTLPVEILDINDRFMLFSWGIAFLVALLVALSLFFIGKTTKESDTSSSNEKEMQAWLTQVMVIGLLMVLLGLLPIWVAGREIGVGFYADRFGLPAMFGASLFLVGFIHTIIRTERQRIILFSLLVGLTAALHFRTANDYRLDWLNQKQFYWQLYWRAPAIQPKTALITDDSPFRFVNGYSLSAAINTLYDAKQVDGKLPYWFVDAYDAAPTKGGNLENFLAGEEIGFSVRSLSFSGSSLNTLIFTYQPSHHCLWVLAPRDVQNIEISDILRDHLPVANLERILPDATSKELPPKNVFGEEPAHSWCYYYQKAALAHQLGEWQKVIALWEEAKQSHYSPYNSFELLPFIDAYLHLSQWKPAAELSRDSYRRQLSTQAMICSIWKPFFAKEGIDAQKTASWLEVKERLKCP